MIAYKLANAAKDERITLRRHVTKLLEAAKDAYQAAAAIHHMGKVGHYGGQIAAFKSVLTLLDIE